MKTRSRGRGAIAVAMALATATALSACSASLGGAAAKSSGPAAVIKIGYVTPRTGALAGFGEADSYVLSQMATYYKQHGITTRDGVRHQVDIISEDTQSDSKRASDVAADLILKDGVKMILVSSTPDTVNPVSDQCEANQVVCISTVAPWEAWYFGRGGSPTKPFKWTYHFFWGTEDIEAVYAQIWKVATGAKNVAELFPNDSDGNGFNTAKGGFPSYIRSDGLKPTNSGLYPDGTTDFSAQIAAYKAASAKILVAVPIPPDFTTFWKQAVQQGYHPEVATVAKAILFPSSVEALGKLGNNLSTEVWWAPSYPYASSLTGQKAAGYAAAFTKSTGKQWTQPLGFDEALFEVATKVISESASLNEDDLRATLARLKLNTIVGPLDWTKGPVPNVAKTPLVGGQWRLQSDGSYQLVIVTNAGHPNIPTGGIPEKISWAGR